MRIQIVKDGECGSVQIPAGEYWVSLQTDRGMIFLSQAGKDIKLPAVRRRKDSKTKRTTVQFYCGGGSTWSLLVMTPKFGEWISMIEIHKSGSKKKHA